ncbi:unnamed protein product [Bemisia tabaci]|uniref:Protein ECT2 n=1 Tax=Bemisia tabaci TaxID=7038 RepID=A0A9P0AK04_BEMTA|nr:unnamed protein product [Bemisia tabaci]
MEVEDDNTADDNSSTISSLAAGKQICIVGECTLNKRIIEAANSFGLPVVFETLDADWQKYDSPTVFVLPEFRDCEKISKLGHSIFGPTALLELAEKKVPIPSIKRPLYSHAMDGLVVCFTGFREKSTLAKLMALVHNMGGHIRREMVSRVTHLIAHCCGGEKYQYALTFRVAIMNESWVHFAWSNRHTPFFSATAPEIVNEHKLQVFSGARICFVGFPEEEKNHMIEILEQNGGEPTDLNDSNCTHIVFDSEETFELLRTKVVVPYSPSSIHRYPTRSSQLTFPNAPKQNSSLTPASPKIHFSPSRKKASTPASYSILTAPASNISSILNDSHSFSTPLSIDYSTSSHVPQTSNATEQSDLSYDTVDDANSSLKRPRKNSLVTTGSCKRFKPSDNKNIYSLSSNCIFDRNYSPVEDMKIEGTPPKSMVSTETRKLKISNRSFKNTSFLHCKRGLNFDSPATRKKTDFFVPELSSIIDSPPETSTPPPPKFKTPLPPVTSPVLSPPSASSSVSAQRSLVVDESRMDCLPPAASFRVHIVKAEWFWASVQNEGCVDEKEYLLEDHLENLTSPCATPNMSGLNTGSSSKRGARKRKRLRDCLVQTKDALSPTQYKRRSSISGRLSCGSLLDYTASPDSHLHDEVESSETPRKNLSARHQVFLELVQTESNYVNILNTIMTLFKSPLETLADSENELLNQTELKIIFGHLPPIHHTHTVMLEELRQLASCWKEESSVGNVFLKYSSELMKAYPPFINYFENMREMLLKCDQTKPRFHAFLKVCQTKPECGRQTLVELLIRPVQRLPSISLLLTDILKHTSKSNPDHCALEAALASIREVMTHINEDKRRTESQLAVFDIFNDIENCPPHLVSSHRSFISRCDVVELSDSLSGRGDSLAFFLFSDIVEVCKKRSKAFNTLKSPKEAGVKMNSGKMFKHVKLMHLSTLKRVIDINETDDCRKVFALMCRNNQELKEKLYSFAITDDSVDKMMFLRTLCRQMANTVCRADAENFLASLDPEQLDIETSDVSTGTLSKAFKFASRTRIKVGRAFSFNKTPSRLKRAMSTMMSPFVDSSQLS